MAAVRMTAVVIVFAMVVVRQRDCVVFKVVRIRCLDPAADTASAILRHSIGPA